MTNNILFCCPLLHIQFSCCMIFIGELTTQVGSLKDMYHFVLNIEGDSRRCLVDKTIDPLPYLTTSLSNEPEVSTRARTCAHTHTHTLTHLHNLFCSCR